MNELQILRDARARIARGWCIGNRGLDGGGGYVDGFDPRAVQWCALGAMDGALGEYCDGAKGEPVVGHLADALPVNWMPTDRPTLRVATYNNLHTQAEVLDVFDKAIAKLSPPRAAPPDWNAMSAKWTVGDDVRSQEIAA